MIGHFCGIQFEIFRVSLVRYRSEWFVLLVRNFNCDRHEIDNGYFIFRFRLYKVIDIEFNYLKIN